MEIGQFSNFNSMDEFAKFSMNNAMQIGKFGQLNDKGFLEGSVSFDVPKISDMKIDTETLNDLNALNINPAASSDAPDSADRLYKSFSAALNDGIQNVNNLQRAANDATEYFASGGNIDIHSVLIASQKAKMGLEMATQLRNKMISAYKEIVKMSF